MIEKIVLDYLNEVLNVPVFMEMPEEKLERFVLVEKTGGSVSNYIKNVTLAIQSYAESLYSAGKLNEEVKEAMDRIIFTLDISNSKLNTDYNFTDTTKKKYRYQAVYDLTY